MATSPYVVTLPWYHRRDYEALLRLVSDRENMPATYGTWLERAESTERQLRKANFDVVRVWIRPDPFMAWCKERNLSPDKRARFAFVSEAARVRPIQR
jgi:hypothetical protein